MKKYRLILAVVWIVFFLADIGIITYMYLQQYIEAQDWTVFMQQLNVIFAPNLGAVIAYYAASGRSSSLTNGPFLIALITTAAWNLVIFVLAFKLILFVGTIEESVETINAFAQYFPWLVGISIGYYFAKS